MKHAVFIDPASDHYLRNRLFDGSDRALNRDGSLEPFVRLRRQLRERGIDANTADFLRRGEGVGDINHYWSFGMIDKYRELAGRQGVRLRGIFVIEPPIVAPRLYRALPALTRAFETVHLHNTEGDGYSLRGADVSKLRKFHYPQPRAEVDADAWNRGGRQNRIVAISGHHHPKWRRPEFYSARIKAMAALSRFDAVDLYGRGWDRAWTGPSMWPAYWLNRRRLMSIYKGTCESKLDILSRYRFCLCLENMPMRGYLTEKLFDCLYAGTVPLYLGAPDIESLVPPEAYVDIRRFPDWAALWRGVRDMSEDEWRRKREAGLAFIEGKGRELYYNALSPLLNLDDRS